MSGGGGGAGAPGGQKAAPPGRSFFLGWPRILAFLITLYNRLVRCRLFGLPLPPGPKIYAIWHSEEITMLPRCGFTGGNVMVSRSKDGDILAAVITRWGYKVSRGSSSRGAVQALRSLASALAAGDSVVLAVDGPRGPRHRAKAGAAYLSARFGVPVCPVGAAVSRAFVFRRSWSRSRLPLPFSRVCGVFGEPFQFGPESLGWDRAAQEARLDGLLRAVTEEAENRLKNWSVSCT